MNNYLPGLNTLRVYAAFCVLYVHAAGVSETPVILSGWNAVSLFFTLSGFLITYRLLQEKKVKGHIHLKRFYIRREMRILPLYFLTLLTCLFILPLFGVPRIEPLPALTAILMIPQVGYGLVGIASMGAATALWSIGVEEMFYLIFPFLMRHFNFVRLCFVVIFVSVLLDGLANVGANPSTAFFMKLLRFECMGVGALAAWIAVHKSRWLYVFYHPATQIATIALLVINTLLRATLPINDLFFPSLIAILLLNIATNPSSVIKLEYRWSRPLANLTYGIYLWHLPIYFVLRQWVIGDMLVFSVLIITLPLAWASYQFIEQPIMRLRQPIESGRLAT